MELRVVMWNCVEMLMLSLKFDQFDPFPQMIQIACRLSAILTKKKRLGLFLNSNNLKTRIRKIKRSAPEMS